jgi:hypothetical protein
VSAEIIGERNATPRWFRRGRGRRFVSFTPPPPYRKSKPNDSNERISKRRASKRRQIETKRIRHPTCWDVRRAQSLGSESSADRPRHALSGVRTCDPASAARCSRCPGP